MPNTPNIRFKGYSDDWEQRKLENLGEIVTGSTPSTSKEEYYSEDGIPWVTPTDISENIVYDTPRKLSKEGQKVGRVVPKDTILVTCIASIGKNTMLGTTGSFNQQINGLVPDFDKYNPYFLFTESALWSEKMKKQAAAGTMQIVNKTEFSELDTMVPKLEEQEKIGTYFRNLDNLITLHQRKCDETKELKKYMLQKMFPKNGEKKPEIRFSGFTDDWEQRKLIEYLEVSKEKNKDEVYNKDDVLSVSGDYGIVNQIEFQGRSFAGASVANYGVVETGDVVYTKSPLKSNPYGIIKTNKGKTGIVSTLYAVYKPLENTHPEFVQIYFEQDARMNNYMHPLVNKGAKNDMKVSDENALKGDVIFPKKEEQIKISEFFSSLDNLITLHQRKCDILKETKKYMLQNMFPQKG